MTSSKKSKNFKTKAMTWKTIFNPFEKYDEKTLFIVGIAFLILLIPIGYWTNAYFTSIYRISYLEESNLYDIIAPTLISFVSTIIVLYLLGVILYRKTRIIDIVNTVLISQIPIILLLSTEKIHYIKNVGDRVRIYQENPSIAFPFLDFVILMLVIFITLGSLIYSFVLFYNGFKTATNIKKWQHITLFCVVTFLTVVICQIFNN